jgi:hypothetical protein
VTKQRRRRGHGNPHPVCGWVPGQSGNPAGLSAVRRGYKVPGAAPVRREPEATPAPSLRPQAPPPPALPQPAPKPDEPTVAASLARLPAAVPMRMSADQPPSDLGAYDPLVAAGLSAPEPIERRGIFGAPSDERMVRVISPPPFPRRAAWERP